MSGGQLWQWFKVGKREAALISAPKSTKWEPSKQDFQRMRCGCTDALHARLEDEGPCDDA
jgi:hypothetical protein